MPQPSDREQLNFVAKVQRLFSDGDFTATYKFALLIALAELSVEKGPADGAALLLSHRELAEKFIELYWQQVAPYSSPGGVSGVLVQNTDKQAAIVNAIAAFRGRHPAATVQAARRSPGYGTLLTEVAKTVAAQPVKYLQNIGGMTDWFLYHRVRGGIELYPGVAFCLRRFHPLVQQLSRSQWVAHVKRIRQNAQILGQSDTLEEFLFESSRQPLLEIGRQLRRVAGGQCFYCTGAVSELAVDHFVPFAMYPRDIMQNFVLAHPACNGSKSDDLAGRRHLEHWLDHVRRFGDDLHEIGEQLGQPADKEACVSVASWAYENAANSGARAWVQTVAPRYESVDASFVSLFE